MSDYLFFKSCLKVAKGKKVRGKKFYEEIKQIRWNLEKSLICSNLTNEQFFELQHEFEKLEEAKW